MRKSRGVDLLAQSREEENTVKHGRQTIGEDVSDGEAVVDLKIPIKASSESSETLLEVVAIEKYFYVGGSGHWKRPGSFIKALGPISLNINRGEFVAVLGPTGCGKTTLLEILGGFQTATYGEVKMAGTVNPKPGPDRGYVFQQPNLFPWLTIEENIAFGAKHLGIYDTSRVEQWLQNVGLDASRDRFPYQVSGGMKARAALARVLITEPAVVLMDEPFGALDAITRSSMQRLLRRLINQKQLSTSVLITHDVEEALLLASRILIMGRSPGVIAGEIRPDYWRLNDNEMRAKEGELAEIRVAITEFMYQLMAEENR